MGQEISESILFNEEKLSRNRFEFVNIIGRGGFGKVWKVIEKKYKIIYAMKEMQKVKVIDKKSVNSIKNERELLSFLNHPFIVNMHFSFQDYDNLYLVLDFLQGGDLRYHVSRHRRFSEEQTRFFIACIIIALEYIHSNNIIHRDIKPENLVFDENGYLRLTDFGIAKKYSANNSNETSGTPGYMSPEVMKGTNHSFGVDFFAVGVIGYEFMLGKRPYVGKTRKDIKEQMMSKQVQIENEELPNGWSAESMNFINKRKPENRLGFNQQSEIKEHSWLKFYPWEDLIEKKLHSPFLLNKRDNYDKRYCELPDKIGIETLSRYDDYKSQEDFCSLFQHFTYCALEEKRKQLQNKTKKLISHKKNQSKSNIAISRHENRNINNNDQHLICGDNSNSKHNHTINSSGKHQFNSVSSNNYPDTNSKRNQQTMTVNIPKNGISMYLVNNNLNSVHRFSGSHSKYNIKTNNKNINTNNKNIFYLNKQNNKKELEIGIGKPPRKYTRSVSNLSSSPYGDKTRAVDYIQRTKDNKQSKKSSHCYQGSMKNLSEFTKNSAKKYSLLSSANKPPKSKNNGSGSIPFNNSNQKKEINGQKVDLAINHNKNITSQCTPMISTNCTIYPTKKGQNDKVHISNISSVVNSLIKEYKMNFHSRSLSSSKLKTKSPGMPNNNNKTNNVSTTNSKVKKRKGIS